MQNDIQQLAEDLELMTADGLDDAIIGVTYDKVIEYHRVVYDYRKCVQILVERDDMEEREAEEFLDFNTVDAYVDDRQPIFMRPIIELI